MPKTKDAAPAAAKPTSPSGPTEEDVGDNAGAIPQHMRQFRSARKKASRAPEPSLIGVHSLTEGNLAHAHELGGLAAPSLAVTDRKHGLDSFGEVTLVAPHHLIDPEQHPVFDSDVYSPRHPSTEHEVNEKELGKIRKWLAPHVEKTGGYIGDLSDRIRKEGASGHATSRGDVRHALASAWLEEQGHPVQPVMVTGKVDHRYEWVKQPAFREFLKQHPQEPDEAHDSPARVEYQRALSEAARQAIGQRSEELARETGDPTDAEDYRGRMLENYFDDGLLHGGAVQGAQRAAEGMDRTEVDKYATQDAIDARVKDLGKDAFEHWAAEKLAPAQGRAYIPRHVGGRDGPSVRKIPYTLENVLKEVTRKVRNGEGFSYGLGNARSMGAKRFRSLEDIKAARSKIVGHEEFEKLKKENDDRFGALSDKLSRYHDDPSGFRVLDGLAGAIGESFQRGKSLYKQLEENGFKGVPPQLRQQVADFAADLIAMPTEYFEAKPQRVVKLHEFAGAAIPHDASSQTRDILRHHGIHAEEYPRGDAAARAAAVERVARARDLLLTEAGVTDELEKAEPLAKADPKDPYVYHVTYHGRLPGIAAEGLRPDAGRGIGTAAYDGNRQGKVFVTGPAGAYHWHGLAQDHATDRFEHPLREGGVPVVLRTPRKGLGLRPDVVANRESISSDAHKTTRTIPPEQIQVYGGKGWIPIHRHDEVPTHEAVEGSDEEGWGLRQDAPLFPHELHPSYRPPAAPKPATGTDVARHKALTTKGSRVTTKHWGAGEIVQPYGGEGHAPVVHVKLDGGGEMGMNIAHVEPELKKAEVVCPAGSAGAVTGGLQPVPSPSGSNPDGRSFQKAEGESSVHLPPALQARGWRLQVHGPDQDGHVAVHAHHPYAGKVGHLNGTLAGDRLKLFDAQVQPSYRGKGIGKALFGALYQHAAQHGATAVDVPEHSTDAARVLARLHPDYQQREVADAGPRVGAYDFRYQPTTVALKAEGDGPAWTPPVENPDPWPGIDLSGEHLTSQVLAIKDLAHNHLATPRGRCMGHDPVACRAHVKRLAQAITSGASLPAIVVHPELKARQMGAKPWVVDDGHHRVAAALMAGKKHVPVLVRGVAKTEDLEKAQDPYVRARALLTTGRPLTEEEADHVIAQEKTLPKSHVGYRRWDMYKQGLMEGHPEAISYGVKSFDPVAIRVAKADKAKEARRQATEDAYQGQAVELGDYTHLHPSKVAEAAQGRDVWLYHGTTSKFVPQILREGLKHGVNRVDVHGTIAPGVRLTARPGGSLGEGGTASRYAQGTVAEHGGHPTVLRVRVPFDHLTPDTDDADLSVGRHQFILDHVPPEAIHEVNGKRIKPTAKSEDLAKTLQPADLASAVQALAAAGAALTALAGRSPVEPPPAEAPPAPASPRVALVLAFDAAGRLLLGRRKDSGLWTLAGGHVEDGEDPAVAARRELKEESGLHAYSLTPMPGVKPNVPGLGPELHVFSALVAGTPHPHLDPDREIAAWRFHDVAAGLAPEIYDHLQGPPGDRNVVRQVFDRAVSTDAEEGDSVEKSEEDLAKGAARRLMPFDPRQRPEGESQIWNWVDTGAERANVPEMPPGPARERALHKLSAATQVRRAADGRREFLLHRGVSRQEDQRATRTPGVIARVAPPARTRAVRQEQGRYPGLSSWTPDYGVAQKFGEGYLPKMKTAHAQWAKEPEHERRYWPAWKRQEYDQVVQARQPIVHSAWVHEDQIHTVPKQYGHVDLALPGYQWQPGPQRLAEEHEVMVRPHDAPAATPQEVEVARGQGSTVDARINQRVKPAIAKAEDELDKAIGDISVGPQTVGRKSHDYSHVLSPELRAQGYGIYVTPEDALQGTRLSATVTQNGHENDVGRLNLNSHPDGPHVVTPHSTIRHAHRGKGLGTAMYEAAYRHAQTMGINQISGLHHTPDARRVHESLARKHGLEFKRPLGDEGFSYALKAEDLAKGELLGHHDPRERHLHVLTQPLTHGELVRACLDHDPDVRAAALRRPEVDAGVLRLLCAARRLTGGGHPAWAVVDYLQHPAATPEHARIALRAAEAEGPAGAAAAQIAQEHLARHGHDAPR